MPSLFVVLGSHQGSRIELQNKVTTIGRNHSNVICLNDGETSRFHAEISCLENGDSILRDLESSNGVFLNTKRIKEQKLQNGDQIQIGRTLFLYTKPIKEHFGQPEHSAPSVILKDSLQPAYIIHSIKQNDENRFFQESQDEFREMSWQAKAHSHLQLMYHTTLVVSQTLDIDRLLNRIMELIFEWVHVDRGCVLLFDSEEKDLVPKVTKIRKHLSPNEHMTISQRIVEYVMQKKEGVLSSDAQKDDRWIADGSIANIGIREAICVPMQGRYGLIGLIYIDTTASPLEVGHSTSQETLHLTPDHLKLMIAIAHQAALAVEDTRYYLGMVQGERLAAVGQTVTVLSHHIKNILQGLSSGSYLVEKGIADSNRDMASKGWQIVEKNQKKISDLVLDMLTFSKEREPHFEMGNINDTIAEVAELMGGRARDLDVVFSWQLDKSIPDFLFDAEQVHRAVTNVVTNAIDAAKGALDEDACDTKTPLVEIQTVWDPQCRVVRVFIDDNGRGIPVESIDDLFRPFLSSKNGNGTGLGLAITQKILQEHKGNIAIESSSSGGARFILELPVHLEKDPAKIDETALYTPPASELLEQAGN